MASDARKQQKKQERRASKRKEKKHALVRRQNVGLAEQLTAASRFPVLHCWISVSLWTNGIGVVNLSRELPGGRVAVANILVDRHCLGVKDAFGKVLSRSEYVGEYVPRLRRTMSLRDAAPADARKVLHDAVAYARGIGLAPHPDYAKAVLLFGDIDPADGTMEIEFGQDGKPFFVAGPNDTPARCRQVLAILGNTCGPGGFEYIMPVVESGSARYLSDGGDAGNWALPDLDVDESEELDDDED